MDRRYCFSEPCTYSCASLFAISGYLYFRTLTFANLKEKLKRRVSSLCVPFIIWNAIYFLLFYIITHVPMIADTLNSTAVVEFDCKSLVGALFFINKIT